MFEVLLAWISLLHFIPVQEDYQGAVQDHVEDASDEENNEDHQTHLAQPDKEVDIILITWIVNNII